MREEGDQSYGKRETKSVRQSGSCSALSAGDEDSLGLAGLSVESVAAWRASLRCPYRADSRCFLGLGRSAGSMARTETGSSACSMRGPVAMAVRVILQVLLLVVFCSSSSVSASPSLLLPITLRSDASLKS